ncbi:carbohydrate-binding protein [Achlya hypogyna]|uniref:Carbohydrate-binding protein n=1 Tax=Achlya hypogyna TaxID=1202772 RepID=A0A1V9Y5K1_ACHHY|nr:carbohydrate-binding protein [Achlya hypogyna]
MDTALPCVRRHSARPCRLWPCGLAAPALGSARRCRHCKPSIGHRASSATAIVSTHCPARACRAILAVRSRRMRTDPSRTQPTRQIPDGVTHVLWGFAQVQAGEVIPRFQTSDAILTSCIQTLRRRCIYSLGVIGGANNNDGMASIRDPPRFVRSVMSLVQRYKFDGIDIDDETNYLESGYSSRGIVAYMTALHRAFQPEKLLLTYDAYMMEASPRCYKGMRCFAKGLERLVDWVNVMAYNIDRNPNLAMPIYRAAVHETFPQWQRHVPKDKITVGLCTGTGCAWGPGPSPDVVDAYVRYAKGAGGIMIYAGSSDIDQGFHTTKAIVAQVHPQASAAGVEPVVTRPVLTTATPQPMTTTPAPTTETPVPTTAEPTTPEATTAEPTTPEPTTPEPTEAPVPGVRPDGVCGTCYNCFYEPIKACFDGWTEAQCTSLRFTWCG